MYLVKIGLGNDLLRTQYQGIDWTSGVLLLFYLTLNNKAVIFWQYTTVFI